MELFSFKFNFFHPFVEEKTLSSTARDKKILMKIKFFSIVDIVDMIVDETGALLRNGKTIRQTEAMIS